MDITVHTITSRFPFTLPSLDDDAEDTPTYPGGDEGSSSGTTAALRSSHADGAHRHATPGGPPNGAAGLELDDAGVCAFVSVGAAGDTPVLSGSHNPASAHGSGDGRHPGSSAAARAALDGHRTDASAAAKASAGMGSAALPRPDLVRLASSLWNVELCRGSAGAASHCILRTPPYLVDGVLYGGATVQVLASGVVRMMTRGSVRATHALARRVRDALHEACVPRQARRAAREEGRLLNAVLRTSLDTSASDEDDVDVAEVEEKGMVTHAGAAAASDGGASPSLAAALAGVDGATPLRRAADSALREPRSSTPHFAPANESGHEHGEFCTIDFVQAVATPRWAEIARLRDDLFAEDAVPADVVVAAAAADGASSTPDAGDHHGLEKNEDGDENADQQQTQTQTQRGQSAPVSASNARAAVPRQRGPVRRATVNVSGDAPLAWWRWFLRGPAGTIEEGRSATTRSKNSRAKTGKSGEAREGDEDEHASGASSLAAPPARRELDGEAGFWSCAGYKTASAGFVRYLQMQRVRLSHHLVTFTVRRHTSMHSLQLALDWRRTEPPPPPPFPRAVAPAPSPLPLASSRKGGLRLSLTSAASASSKPSATSTRSSGGPQWVTEASAVNFFMDSTFIAESTAPYGLESVRVDREVDGSNVGSAASGTPATASRELPVAVGTAQLTSQTAEAVSAVAAVSSPSPLPSSTVLRNAAAMPTAPAKRTRRGGTVTSGLTSSGLHDGSVEHVTCVLHSTGRVSLTAASEAALRQLCEVLLIPFLVATANITW